MSNLEHNASVGMMEILEEKVYLPSPRAVWQNAENHGWHSPSASLGEDLALIHSEVSEALEAYRVGRMTPEDGDHSVAEELADVIIRTLHVAAKHDLDIERTVWQKHRKNITRGHRHGGKRL